MTAKIKKFDTTEDWRENSDLNRAVAELYLRNDWLKKSLTWQGVTSDDE